MGRQGVDVVIESTGLFTARDAKPPPTCEGGARRVIISAPSGDADATICMGVNDQVFDPATHTVISNASCTTNCLAPLAKVLDDRFGIERGLMTTVHAYTTDQSLQDLAHPSRKGTPDLRRMRAADPLDHPGQHAARPAPSGRSCPQLNGRLDGAALRVPTPTGSITDLSAEVRRHDVGSTTSTPRSPRRRTSAATAGCSSTATSRSSPPTSSGTRPRASSRPATRWSPGNLVKVLGWYDNEWGYSNRLVDLVGFVGDG